MSPEIVGEWIVIVLFAGIAIAALGCLFAALIDSFKDLP